MKHYFSIKHFFKKTPSLAALKTWKNTDWLTDWLTQQAFINDIPSQMHSSPRTLWWIVLILLFVLSKGNKVLASSLVLEGSLIHIDLKDIRYFDSLILSNHFFSSFALVGNNCKATLQHFKPSVLFFCRNSVFWLLSTIMEKIYETNSSFYVK